MERVVLDPHRALGAADATDTMPRPADPVPLGHTGDLPSLEALIAEVTATATDGEELARLRAELLHLQRMIDPVDGPA